jgi:signal transduction histidine kinase
VRVTQLMRRNALAALIGVVILALAFAAPQLLDYKRAPVVEGVVQTLIAVVGTLVALLVYGRYRRSRNLSDLLIVASVFLLAWLHTAFQVVPDLINPNSIGNGYSERVEIWGSAVTLIVAAWYLLTASRTTANTRGPPRWTLPQYSPIYLPISAGVLAMVPLDIFVPVSHVGLFQGIPLSQTPSPVLYLIGAIMFLVASWRLCPITDARSDAILSWIAAGCVLGAFAQVSSALLPAHSVEWLRPSDILRALMVSTWAWGATVEIRTYWAAIGESSRRDAERKVAFDLHDGIAQELALFTSYLNAAPEERTRPQWHEELQWTAERALDNIRRTINVLAHMDTPPQQTDLQRAVRDVVHGDKPVHIEIEANAVFNAPDPFGHESIVGIVREAVMNAVRHGDANSIRIQLLSDDGPLAVRIVDDGVGFEPAMAERKGRLGLVIMRQRAEAIGAQLVIGSAPGQGTTVELLWP